MVQVHDELLLEVKESEMDKAMDILKNGMKNVAQLSVDLEVDIHEGKDWYEAK